MSFVGPQLPCAIALKSEEERANRLFFHSVIFILLVNVVHLGLQYQFSSFTKPLALTLFVFSAANTVVGLFCLFLLKWKRFLASKTLFSTSNQIFICYVAVMVGPKVNVDLFLLTVFVFSWLVFTQNEALMAWLNRFTSLSLFLGLQVLFRVYDFQPLISPHANTWVFLLSNSLLTCITFGFVLESMARQIRARERGMIAEQNRSDQLLNNILPSQVAGRLKGGERPIADRVEEATVVFADLVNFTRFSNTTDPDRLVSLLNDLFSCFDQIVELHAAEKIKTIGDAYMFATGVTNANPGHAVSAVRISLAIQEEAQRWIHRHGLPLDLRIGVDSGPSLPVSSAKTALSSIFGATQSIGLHDLRRIVSRAECSSLPTRQGF